MKFNCNAGARRKKSISFEKCVCTQPSLSGLFNVGLDNLKDQYLQVVIPLLSTGINLIRITL